ncbi:MAG: hypothetical protein M1837_006798 [Sclerophora amabilis]|nr:MAG: hypothetical protein M1837_006798 [Sclerophora amabilis]
MPVPTFQEAIEVAAVDSHTYRANLSPEWCIGTVPHGGYVTAVFMRVASQHFVGTLSKQRQPHTITLHLEFLRRTQAGPAIFTVQDIKLGQQTSTIHVSLKQDDREEVVGYITNANLQTESGVSLQTRFSLDPLPAPVDVSKLRQDADAHWELQTRMPFPEFRKAATKVTFFFPRDGHPHRSMNDEWITFQNGERFTNESIGYAADMWPQLVENYREISPYDGQKTKRNEEGKTPKVSLPARLWYPTLLLNLDIKKALPEEGVEWLFLRVQAKTIKNGRLDLEVIILDETGDIVALSHHVSFVLSAERNTAARKPTTDGSKL